MDDSKLIQVVTSAVKGMGFTCVEADFCGEEKAIFRVLIENRDGSGVTIADCAKVSRSLSTTLDVEDLITAAYKLEVSSTGMDRPLTIIEDYDRFKGFLIKLESHDLVGGRKRFKGVILGRKEDVISLEMPEGKTEVHFDNVKKAKLVVTDEMIRGQLRKKKEERRSGKK